MKLDIFGMTDIGSVRENNEDNFIIYNLTTKEVNPFEKEINTNETIALIVADGMGGAVAGETASQTLVEESVIFLKENSDLDIETLPSECMHISHKKAHQLIEENPKLMGMGTVGTISIIRNDKIYISQIGDTRLYIFRDKNLIQITEDQNFVTELVKIGIITKEQAQIHPQRNAVTQAVGSIEPILPVDTIEEIQVGDLILICSDGLNSMISDLEIQLILETKKSLKVKVENLIEAAKESGGHDNITIVLVEVI